MIPYVGSPQRGEPRKGAKMTDVRVDNPADFPPQEDTVERLWTPQRMTYVLRNSEDRPTKPKTKECPFCAGPKKSDEDGLIACVARTCSPS